MKVVVIGDAHLKNDARLPDKLASLDQILLEQRATVSLWAVPGDLYDGLSDVPSRNAWVDRLAVMADAAPVVICYGNHDRDGDLDLFEKVEGRFPIMVFDQPKVVKLELDDSYLTVFVFPYPHRAGIVAAGVAPSEVVNESRPLLEAIFMDAGAQLAKARHEGTPTLFLGHANIAGSRMSTGQPLIGQEIELDANLLLRLGDCPKVLNHIHLAQEIAGGVYCGSIAAMSWGETQEMRYVTVEYGAGPAWTIQSWPLQTPAMVHVEATFDRMEFAYDIAPVSVAVGSDVRVRVRFQETERQFFDLGRQQVVAAFAHARRLQIEPICLDEPGLRSPEVANATTLTDKLKAWCEVNGEPVPEDLAATVAEYEATSGEQVIATFHARMRAAQENDVDRPAD